MNPAYITGEVGPVFWWSELLGNVSPPCLAIGANLCITHHHVQRILIGGSSLFARRGYVCLFLILGNDGAYGGIVDLAGVTLSLPVHKP